MFFCHQCGLCCKRLDKLLDPKGKSKVIKEIIKEFPYKHKDGVCEKLVDNKCSVYENRPVLCNVERFRERVFPEFEKSFWFQLVELSCKDLMKKSGEYTDEEIDEIYERRVNDAQSRSDSSNQDNFNNARERNKRSSE